MASVPLSSLCLPQRKLSSPSPSPSPFCFSFSHGISDNLRFGSASVGFSSIKKKNRRVRVSVCRAASVVFRDLDADDFRHPLDKQVPLNLFFLLLKLLLLLFAFDYQDKFKFVYFKDVGLRFVIVLQILIHLCSVWLLRMFTSIIEIIIRNKDNNLLINTTTHSS